APGSRPRSGPCVHILEDTPLRKETQMMLTTTPSAKEKNKALDLALQQIEKQFGKGAIMKLGDGEAPAGIEVIPTGSIGLDMALGVGGVRRGRIVEIYGPEWS